MVSLGVISGRVEPRARPVGAISHPRGLGDIDWFLWCRPTVLFHCQRLLFHSLSIVVRFSTTTYYLRETVDPDLKLIVLPLDPTAILNKIRSLLVPSGVTLNTKITIRIPRLNIVFSAKRYPHL